jgi:hypothetical protein
MDPSRASSNYQLQLQAGLEYEEKQWTYSKSDQIEKKIKAG